MRLLLIALTLGLLATPAVAQIAVPELTPEQERTAHEAMRMSLCETMWSAA